jgi:hypothetical protein
MGVLMRVTGSAKRISGWDSLDRAEEFVATGTFLEGDGCQDLLVGQVVVGRDDDELVVIIAPTVDDTDAEPLAVVERLGVAGGGYGGAAGAPGLSTGGSFGPALVGGGQASTRVIRWTAPAAMNAFTITFEGRLTPSGTY